MNTIALQTIFGIEVPRRRCGSAPGARCWHVPNRNGSPTRSLPPPDAPSSWSRSAPRGMTSRFGWTPRSRPGAFVATLRDALLAGEADLAVHSFKDLPSAPSPDWWWPPSPDARMPATRWSPAKMALGLAGLPEEPESARPAPVELRGCCVRPDLRIVAIRGNVDTRLRKVVDGEVDAVVLAAAGLVRVGRAAEITEYPPMSNYCCRRPPKVRWRSNVGWGNRRSSSVPWTTPAARCRSRPNGPCWAVWEAACTTAVGAQAASLDDDRLELDG